MIALLFATVALCPVLIYLVAENVTRRDEIAKLSRRVKVLEKPLS